MNNEINLLKKQLKENIQQLIDKDKLFEAKELVEQYKTIVKYDTEAYSMEAVILIMEGKIEEAKEVLIQGLNIDDTNFDLNYNLAYTFEQTEKFSKALEYYTKAENYCNDDNLRKQIVGIVNKIRELHPDLVYENRLKMAFFVKDGMDSFLGDIIEGLSSEYETKKIVVTEHNQIDKGMQWADICWFEWCDDLIIYGSKYPLSREKKIICRLHSYEAFTDHPSNVNWDNVDKVIFIAKHIREFVTNKFKINKQKTEVIPNGIDLSRYEFRDRKHGYNIAYLGYINYKKGPMLLLHTFKAIYDKDNRYKLYIAGQFQDDRDVLYFKQMITEFGIENNVFYEGWQNNLNQWLEDKNYILCTSILESQNMSVMQAMAKGIKPIVHNFVGAKEIYECQYLWNTINDAVELVTISEYKSKQYRKFVECNYSLKNQLKKISTLLRIKSFQNISFSSKFKNRNLKISYVMPVYNGEKFIKKSIDSILRQRIQPYEILILDDNSSDNSYEIIKKYAEENEKIIVKRNEKNLGEAISTNKLFKMAKGDFIKILHQDDWLDEEYSSSISLIDGLEDFSFIVNDFGYVQNNNMINDYLKKLWDSYKINPNNLSREALQKIMVMVGNLLGGPSNVLFNRKKLSQVNYYDEFEDIFYYAGDYLTFLKLINISKPLIIFKQLSYRNEHENNVTSKYINSIERIRGYFDILNRFEFILNEDEKRLAYGNLCGKAIYSINNCKDDTEKKLMIEYVLKNFKYLKTETIENLNSIKRCIVDMKNI